MDIKCRIVDWHEIQKWSEDISDKMMADGYIPDMVIGVTRGGWVPARIVCDYLVIKELYSLKTEHWGLTATKDGKALLKHAPQLDVKGKSVLIVDDITDTGDSLKLAMDYIIKQGASGVKTATLLHINHSKLVPEYYSENIDEKGWAWFIFPWNFNEDMKNLVPKAIEGYMTQADIKKILDEKYDMKLSDVKLIEVLLRLESSGVLERKGKFWTASKK